MKFTLSWLQQHLDTTASASAVGDALTMLGLEVESITDRGEALKAFSVAHILEAAPHPDASRLQVCKVDTGSEVIQVVCGAPNARAGLKVVLGKPGTYVPGLDVTLKKAAIRGVESNGMLCSAAELQLGEDGGGIIELPGEAVPGEPAAGALGVDDPVFDISVTPNRGDCLSIRGIARDLAAAGIGTLKPWTAPQVQEQGANPFTVITDDAQACPLFAVRLLEGVKNQPSPAWLQQQLQAIGLKPVSTLVDVTNFFAYHLGRPLHVFDADRLQGKTLRVNRASGGEVLEGLGQRTVTLPADAVVIRDDAGIISLAGILGGASTACTMDTTRVLLESALFDAAAISRAGQATGVFTDARSRFERGVDTSLVLPALDAAAQMIQELCGGTISSRSMAGSTPQTAAVIAFDTQRVQTLGGVSLAAEDADCILNALGFTKAAGGWQVPAWRHDIDGEADLVEEILRVRSYDALPVTPLPLKAPVMGVSTADKVRRLLAGLGMTEAVTWSFTDSTLAALFGGHAGTARVANPISSDLDVLRPGLLPNLLLAARRNLDNNVQGNSLFEVGAAFQGGTPGQQQLTASGIFWGNISTPHWQHPARAVDAFDAKGMMQRVLQLFGLAAETMPVQADAPDWYHPGQSGTLALGPGKVLATFGMMHPALLQKMGIEVPAAAFEVHLDALPASKTKSKQPLTLSPYQPVERDFAFVVPDTLPFATLQKAITTADRTLIAETRLFDVYTGKGIPDGHKSLALTVRLEPASATLDETALQAVQQKIIAAAGKVGAILR